MPEEPRDFVPRHLCGVQDVEHERGSARVLRVQERGGEALREAVDHAEQEEGERVRGKRDPRQLVRGNARELGSYT